MDKIGRRVYYTGDMANQPGWGTLTEIAPPGRFSEQWKIIFDDGRQMWVFPAAFSPGSGKRFYWEDEWRAERTRKLKTLQVEFQAEDPQRREKS